MRFVRVSRAVPLAYLKKSPIFSPETAATSFESPIAPTMATRRNQEMMRTLYGILILRIPLQPWDHIAFALPIKKGTTRPPLLGRLSNRASTCNAVSLLSESSQHCAQSSAALLDNLRLPGLLCTCQAYLPAPLYGGSYITHLPHPNSTTTNA